MRNLLFFIAVILSSAQAFAKEVVVTVPDTGASYTEISVNYDGSVYIKDPALFVGNAWRSGGVLCKETMIRPEGPMTTRTDHCPRIATQANASAEGMCKIFGFSRYVSHTAEEQSPNIRHAAIELDARGNFVRELGFSDDYRRGPNRVFSFSSIHCSNH